MNTHRMSVCSLSVVLAAVAGQAPCGAGVLVEKTLLQQNTLNAFGLTHSAAGNAQLSMSPTGALVVSNIGSSGLDGVTVPIGDVRGHSMSMDLGDMGALAPGGLVTVAYPYAFGDQTVFVEAQPDGSARLGADICPGGGRVWPTCVTVQILDDDVLVAERDYVCGETDHFVAGDIGTDPVTGEPLSISFEQIGENYVATVALPVSTPLTIVGNITQTGDQTVTGNLMRLTFSGLPPAQAPSGPVRITASDTVPIEIVSMSLTLPYWQEGAFGEDPFAHRRSGRIGVRSLGTDQKILGMPEAAACNAHNTVWYECKPPLTPTRVLQVSNIGSSGLDGVAINFDNNNPCGPGLIQCPDGRCVSDVVDCPAFPADRVIHFGGTSPALPDYLDLDSDGDTLRLSAVGTIGGGTGSGLGTAQLVSVPGENAVNLIADFTAIGSDLYRAEIYLGGVKVGEHEEFRHEAKVMGKLGNHPNGADVTSCGKLGGDVLGPPCFFFKTLNPFTYEGGGQVLVGDEVRILAASAPAPIEFIAELHVTGTNLEDFNFRPDLMQDSGLYENTLGTRVRKFGESVAMSGDGQRLTVSNIGSSGEDGVSIDLGGAHSSSVRLASGGDFAPGGFFNIAYRRFEPDPDNNCTIGIDPNRIAPGQVSLSPYATNAAAMIRVNLRNGDGDITGTFLMSQAQALLVTDPAGVAVEIAELDARSSFDPNGGGIIVECLVTHLIANPGGGGGGGVLVESPAGTAYQGVGSIEVCWSVPWNLEAQSHWQPQLEITKGAVGGGPLSDMVFEDLSMTLFGVPSTTTGNARWWVNKKMKQAEVGQAEEEIDDCINMVVSNIGSSGQDGVRFTCIDDDCDGVDDDCDGFVEEIEIDLRDLSSPGGPITTGTIKVETMKSPGGPGGGAVYLYQRISSGPAGDEIDVGMDDEAALPYEFLTRVEIFDDAGRLLAVEDENSYPSRMGNHPNVITFVGSAKDGKKKKKIKVNRVDAATPLLSSGGTGGDLPGPMPVILTRSGRFVDQATGYLITLYPVGDVPAHNVNSVEVTAATGAGSGGSLMIKSVGLVRAAPPCPADVNGDGIIDNGDIGVFITLFLSQDPRVDFTGDGVVDNGDIGAFIAAFLAGC